MYDPTVGKWISADPISFKAGDANLHRYVENVPTTKVDPTGLQPPINGDPGWTGATMRANLSPRDLKTPIPLKVKLGRKNLKTSYLLFTTSLWKLEIIEKYGPNKLQEPNVSSELLGGAAGGGQHSFSGPLSPNAFFGAMGAEPCLLIVVLSGDGKRAGAFHLRSQDDCPTTITQYDWPEGSTAAISGSIFHKGNQEQMKRTLKELKRAGIEVEVIANTGSIFVGPEGETGNRWWIERNEFNRRETPSFYLISSSGDVELKVPSRRDQDPDFDE